MHNSIYKYGQIFQEVMLSGQKVRVFMNYI
jgi:hypothetical protein